MKNIFDKGLEKPKKGFESFELLLEHRNVKIQKIRSHDFHKGEWYEQGEDEWVVLLEGSATLEYEDGLKQLRSGDYLFIPRGTKHRVADTSSDALWLAFFIA